MIRLLYLGIRIEYNDEIEKWVQNLGENTNKKYEGKRINLKKNGK